MHGCAVVILCNRRKQQQQQQQQHGSRRRTAQSSSSCALPGFRLCIGLHDQTGQSHTEASVLPLPSDGASRWNQTGHWREPQSRHPGKIFESVSSNEKKRGQSAVRRESGKKIESFILAFCHSFSHIWVSRAFWERSRWRWTEQPGQQRAKSLLFTPPAPLHSGPGG